MEENLIRSLYTVHVWWLLNTFSECYKVLHWQLKDASYPCTDQLKEAPYCPYPSTDQFKEPRAQVDGLAHYDAVADAVDVVGLTVVRSLE